MSQATDPARIQSALDAAELACRGLTPKHVVGIAADDLRTLIDAAGDPLSHIAAQLRGKTGNRRLWLHVGLLQMAVRIVRSTTAGSADA